MCMSCLHRGPDAADVAAGRASHGQGLVHGPDDAWSTADDHVLDIVVRQIPSASRHLLEQVAAAGETRVDVGRLMLDEGTMTLGQRLEWMVPYLRAVRRAPLVTVTDESEPAVVVTQDVLKLLQDRLPGAAGAGATVVVRA
jgi:hypothetical protein